MAQAQSQVTLERELATLRTLVTSVGTAPEALVNRGQSLAQVLAVLHANLVAARQALGTVLPQET